MPHGALKLKPGIDQIETYALNEAGVSTSQLVRYMPDRNGLGLVQKLGGWRKYFPNQFPTQIRALHSWQALNLRKYLAVGCDNSLNLVIDETESKNISPTYIDVPSIAVSLDTVAGSNLVKVNATGSNLQTSDVIWFKTQISVGGIIVSGVHQVYQNNGSNQFTIAIYDKFGNPVNAVSTVTNGGVVPQFATLGNSAIVTVTFPNHGLAVGDNFSALIPTPVGGLTISGEYVVQSVIDANNFRIASSTLAASTTSAFMNGGNAYYTYLIGISPPTLGSGFGILGYGRGAFGAGSSISGNVGTQISTDDWTFDNWGEILVACPNGHGIYTWMPNSITSNAVVIANAPIVNSGIFVAMPQRQIVAYGSTFTGIKDPLLIRWCDNEDYNEWIAQPNNQAGSYRISIGSEIVAAIQGPQQSLVFTDVGVWSMQYVGYPYVYGFNLLASGCGLIARKAVGTLNDSVFWMSPNQFNVLTGNGVNTIPCPVWDVMFQNLNMDQIGKIRCATNSMFNEVTWYFPSGTSTENDSYVKYQTDLKQWDIGQLGRTAWRDQSVTGEPIGAGTDRYLYQHEVSQNADGQPLNASFRTGYFALSEGNEMIFIDQVWPDMKWGYYGHAQNAQVLLTFYVANYPGETPKVYGPFALTQGTQYVTPRFRARLVSIKIESQDVDSFWRLGLLRYRFSQDGKF